MTDYDAIAPHFDRCRRTLSPRETPYFSLLQEGLTKQSRILDLGCGTGRPMAEALAMAGHRITGVDASASLLSLAHERLPQHRWIHARMEEVDLDGEAPFDAVICWDSLFHLPRHRHRPMLHRIRRWIRPGGRLMVSSGGVVEPAGAGFVDRMFDHDFYYDSLPPDEMMAALREAGFAIVVSEMSDPPDGGRDRGKWATVADATPSARPVSPSGFGAAMHPRRG